MLFSRRRRDRYRDPGPQRGPRAASERRRSGLSPALTNKAAAVSGPTPKRSSSSGAVRTNSLSILSSSSAIWSSRPWIRRANEHSDALWAAMTGSPEREGRSLADSATSAATLKPFEATTELIGGGNQHGASARLLLTRAWRAERLATTRTRMASMAPSLDLEHFVARPPRACSSSLDRIERITSSTASALGSIRPVALDHLDVGSTQC